MWWWCNYMTTKQFFLSPQWLVFSQLLRNFSSCLSYFSALFNTSDYYFLLERNSFVTWNVHKHCCFPSFLYAFLHSFFHYLLSSLHALLSILVDLSIIFGLSVPKYVGKMLLTSVFLHANPLARNMFSLLILIYQVSVWICLFQSILTLSDHIFLF